MRWDRKKKKMVAVNPVCIKNSIYNNSSMSLYIFQDPKAGKIKTESGTWIPATYKSNRYAEWKEHTKIAENSNESDEEDGEVAKKGTILECFSACLLIS